MAKSKGSLVTRQRAALQRLESAYETFKAGDKDKQPWTSTRNSGKRIVYHKGNSYDKECERIKNEISILKEKISHNQS